MANLTKTYQGDLTQSIARAIYGGIVRAGDSALEAKQAAEGALIAANLETMRVIKEGDPKEGIKPMHPDRFSPVKANFQRGEFFKAALKHQMTPNPMGIFGDRFAKKPFSFSDPNIFKGQTSQTFVSGDNSPYTPRPTGIGVPAANIARNVGQPFPFIAAGSDIRNQGGLGKVTELFNTKSGQPMKVKDPLLGKFFTSVSMSLSASILGMTDQMDDNEEVLLSVEESVFGTIKKLETSTDTLETKLDNIIDALRQQNRDDKISADTKEADKKEAKIEEEKRQFEGEVIQKRAEDDAEFALRDLADESQDEGGIDDEDFDFGQFKAPELARGGVVEGPQSGYPAILHGREAVIPLDTPATRQQNFASGTSMINASQNNVFRGNNQSKASFDKFVPGMFKEIIEEKIGSTPLLKDTTEMLGKAIELPVKASGLVAFNVLGKALKGMTALAGDVSGPLKTVLSPLSAFGVDNSVINSLTRDINVGGAAVQRMEVNKNVGQTQESKQQNIFTKFFNIIKELLPQPKPEPKEDGDGGGGYRSGGGMYAGGGPGNIIEGTKNWWNRGRNVRVPNENAARFFGKNGLMADDAKQLTRTNKAFKSGATGIKGWNPFKAFTPNMVKTGPTPAVRQAFERPVRSLLGGGVKGVAKKLPILDLLLDFVFPKPLADGTLDAHRHIYSNNETSHMLNRTDKSDKMSNFVEIQSFENQVDKINQFQEQQSKIIEINNNANVSQETPEEDMNHISNNPNSSLDAFFSSPYNYR